MKTIINDMKKQLAIILSMFLITGIAAQTKKADDIIREITEKTQAYQAVEFEFTFTYEDPVSGEDVSEGGKLLISGDMYVLEIEGQKVYCDGETLWTHIVDAWEVQINSLGEDDGSVTPSRLLTTYNENYKARLSKEFSKDGVNYQLIELKPGEGKKYVMLEVLVDAGKQEISEITIHDKNGGKVHYRIDTIKANPEVTEKDFIFRPEDHPEVEVIDMR
jgi:outer membrane lipoprotein carrier protein